MEESPRRPCVCRSSIAVADGDREEFQESAGCVIAGVRDDPRQLVGSWQKRLTTWLNGAEVTVGQAGWGRSR